MHRFSCQALLRSTALSACLVSLTWGAAAAAERTSEDPDEVFRRLFVDPPVPVELSARSPQQPLHFYEPTGGSTWSSAFGDAPAGQGLGSSANVIGTYQGNVVVAGDFVGAGNTATNRIAMWNGTAWTALGAGLNGRVFAMVEFGGNLVVGGAFTQAGTREAWGIAQWDGVGWLPIGTGLGGTVYALHVYNGALFAGGDFPAHLRTWNGSTWEIFDLPFNDSILALAEHDGDLFVGGRFSRANGLPNGAERIVRWNFDLDRWTPINAGGRGLVTSIHVVNDSVYVGGAFSDFGPANNPVVSPNFVVANMTAFAGNGQWVALGEGAGGPVLSITDHAGSIVLGGEFTNVGMLAVDNIATFNPANGLYGSFGSGLGGPMYAPLVRAAASVGPDLWVGGWFVTAGGTPSRHVARWGTGPGAPVSAPVLDSSRVSWSVGPNPAHASTRIAFSLPNPAQVSVTVHDVAGRRVATLLDEVRSNGFGTVAWDRRAADGGLVGAGVYFVRLAVDGAVETKSLVLAR